MDTKENQDIIQNSEETKNNTADTTKENQNSDSKDKSKGNSLGTILIAILIGWAFVCGGFLIDVGGGPLLTINEDFLNNKKVASTEKVVISQPTRNVRQPKNDCGLNMVKLITSKNTINGATESCWKGENDFATPVSNVHCLTGYHMTQSGSTATNIISVDCVPNNR